MFPGYDHRKSERRPVNFVTTQIGPRVEREEAGMEKSSLGRGITSTIRKDYKEMSCSIY
jgi:hypothetical protein